MFYLLFLQLPWQIPASTLVSTYMTFAVAVIISRAALPCVPIPLPYLPIQALPEFSILYMIAYRELNSHRNRIDGQL